jgi:hypothetical protein
LLTAIRGLREKKWEQNRKSDNLHSIKIATYKKEAHDTKGVQIQQFVPNRPFPSLHTIPTYMSDTSLLSRVLYLSIHQ